MRRDKGPGSILSLRGSLQQPDWTFPTGRKTCLCQIVLNIDEVGGAWKGVKLGEFHSPSWKQIEKEVGLYLHTNPKGIKPFSLRWSKIACSLNQIMCSLTGLSMSCLPFSPAMRPQIHFPLWASISSAVKCGWFISIKQLYHSVMSWMWNALQTVNHYTFLVVTISARQNQQL